MSTSRRTSHRIAVKASAIDDDDAASEAYVPSVDSPIVRRRTSKAFEARADAQAKGSSLAAGRMARNRESARRSRAGFAERLAALVTEFKECQVTLRQLRSSAQQVIGVEATAAQECAAADSVRKAFVEDVPPTRASGSRTAISDEELERQAALGDIKAERMLSNRNSARESRRRKWREWNETRLSHEIAKAACRVLAPIVAGAFSHSHRASTPPTPERGAGSSSASVVSSVPSDASVATATPHGAPEVDEDVVSIRAEFAQAFGAVSAAAAARRIAALPAAAPSASSSRRTVVRTGAAASLGAAPAFPSQLALSQSAELGIPVDSAEVDGAATTLAMAA